MNKIKFYFSLITLTLISVKKLGYFIFEAFQKRKRKT